VANSLQLRPIFNPFPFEKNVKEALVPGVGACKNLAEQHPLGAEIWSSEKCVLGGYDSTSRSSRLLDQTSPDLFCLTREESR